MGRRVEPQLGVRLVGREQEVVLARQLGRAAQKLERRHRTGRVVRVVEPDDRGALATSPRGPLRDPAESRSDSCSGSCSHLRARKRRAAVRAPGSPAGSSRRAPCRRRGRARPARGGRSPPSSRRSGRSPCPGRAPPRSGGSHQPATASRSSGRPFGERIGRDLRQALRERLPDHRVGRLAWIALAEVDQLDALRRPAGASPARA